MTSQPIRREELLERLRNTKRWDVVVIGGGATGLGTALDATSRGLETLLLEAHDFAKATSSRSTKLIHGGVRYLARGNIHLVREALAERSILARNAPGLVWKRSFLIPAYRWWEKPFYGLGLAVYDWMGDPKGWERSRRVDRPEAISLVPNLVSERLRGGVVYTDGQFDDARLAIALMRTIVRLGQVAINYLPVRSLIHREGRVRGVVAEDDETGERFEIEARVVVNATGVFTDDVRRLDDARSTPTLRPSRGSHIVVDAAFLAGDTAVLSPLTDDGRVLFAIPWEGSTLIGTTDTPVENIDLEPRAAPDDVAWLLNAAGRFLTRKPTIDDVRSAFAGLRPLIQSGGQRSTAKLSREHAIWVSKSGLVSIAGGKWTTYRRMAMDATDRALEVAGLNAGPSRTSDLALANDARVGPVPVAPSADDVARFALFEQARTVEDVLARRARTLFLDARLAGSIAPAVSRTLAQTLGRDAVWESRQIADAQQLTLFYLPLGKSDRPK